MKNNEKMVAQQIKGYYEEKKESKLDHVIKLNEKAHRPAEIFAYTFGTIGSLVLGTGMCFAMKVIGTTLSFAMPLGICVGLVGIAMVSVNYFIYKKMVKNGKKKYGAEILKLTDEILNETKEN